LFTHAARSRTALVLVGDPRQLPEIEAGGLFTQLALNPRTLHLTANRRQQDCWERDALARLRAGNINPAIDAYSSHGRIHQAPDSETLRAELVSDYLHARANAGDAYEVAILVVSRADVAQLNALVRAALIAQGELGATSLHLSADDTADLVAGVDCLEMRTGGLVTIGRNDNRLGLYNGTRAVVTAIHVETDSPATNNPAAGHARRPPNSSASVEACSTSCSPTARSSPSTSVGSAASPSTPWPTTSTDSGRAGPASRSEIQPRAVEPGGAEASPRPRPDTTVDGRQCSPTGGRTCRQTADKRS
jgi:hypothetical protein